MINHDYDSLVTERIKNSQNNLVGENNDYKLYIDFTSLNGFEFLQIHVLSQLKVKTLNGCEISFLNTNKTITLNSDTIEIESEYSNELQNSIFTFDIDLEEELINFINEEIIETIEIRLENKTINIPLTHFENLKKVITIQEIDEDKDEDDLENVDFEEI